MFAKCKKYSETKKLFLQYKKMEVGNQVTRNKKIIVEFQYRKIP